MSLHRSLARITASVSFLTFVGTTHAAFAQSGADAAVRRDLLSQATVARTSNDHARALDLALRAGRIEMTPSLRMFIAQEEASLGQVAEALNSAELCAREAEHDPTMRNRELVLRTCESLAVLMRTRVARVTVAVPTVPPPGFRVMIAGHELNEAFYGIPYIVTPGTVTIDASAVGLQPFHRAVDVAIGQTVEVPVQLEAARTVTNTTVSSGTVSEVTTSSILPPAITTQTTSSAGPSSIAPPHETRTHQGPGAGPYVVAGIGVLALAASVGFFVARGNAINNLEAQCSGADHTSCPPSAQPAFDNASTWNLLTDVALGVGAAAVATGVVWWIAARVQSGHSNHATSAGITPLAEGGAMFQIGGTL